MSSHQSKLLNSEIIDSDIINIIEEGFEKRKSLHSDDFASLKLALKKIIPNILTKLEIGKLRVACKEHNTWKINTWIKKAILISFILNDNKLIKSSPSNYYDKLIPRFHNADVNIMQSIGARIVPPACVRTGAYIAPNTIIMPSFVNIGAFVDEGTMVDSWVTVGSCAQIGKNVHLSAGVNIGGVLEPMQDSPTIIEDNCFIGANSSIVEGVIIEQNSVIGMGVMLGKSTKIYDRKQDTISYGKIPSGSVVIPGTIINDSKDKYTSNKYGVNCAIIVKQVDSKTLASTSINQILRENIEI